MYLTEQEERILGGEEGEGRRLAMELLVAVGEAFDAERMIPITRAHVATSAQEGDTYWASRLADGGARCVVRTTTNPPWDYEFFSGLAELQDWEVSLLHRTVDAYRRLGAVLSFSCTPYVLDNVPSFGEHVAFSESSAPPYVNSVLGARTNREGSPSALAAAVLGRTPYYGLHIEENRKANYVVKVEAPLRGPFDYGLLGIHLGGVVGSGIPYFSGIKGTPSREDLIYLGAELATSGSVAMYHIEGFTPEARLKGNDVIGDAETLEVGIEDLRDTMERWSESGGRISSVILGCPHYTYEQLVEMSRILRGKRIHPSVDLYILTSKHALEMARRSGVLGVIQAAGGRVVADTCIDQPVFRKYERTLGCTDSFKNAYYRRRRGQKFVLADMRTCLEAAFRGEV